MARTTTISVRLKLELRSRLADYAKSRGMERNTVMVRALEEYLKREDEEALRQEARAESLRIRDHEAQHPDSWEDYADWSDGE